MPTVSGLRQLPTMSTNATSKLGNYNSGYVYDWGNPFGSMPSMEHMKNTSSRLLERQPLGLGIRPALLVVDVSVGFTSPDSPLGSEASAVVAATAELMQIFHQRALPVFLTTVVYHNDEQAPVFRARLPALNVLTAGSRWVEIDPGLPLTAHDTVIEKWHASAFHGTTLDAQLRADGVDSLVVCGLTTSGCVRASAVDGLQNNYRVVVAREACGDRDPAAHEANLHDLHAKYADVVGCAEIIRMLTPS